MMITRCMTQQMKVPHLRLRHYSAIFIEPDGASVPPDELQLIPNVISEEQEIGLIRFVDALVKRKRYSKNHFDDVILNYRESEIYPEKLLNFPDVTESLSVLEETVRRHHGGADMTIIPPHVIDLHSSGFIAAHIDSVKFSGDMIAALSLGSSRILRLCLDPEFSHLYQSDVNGDGKIAKRIEFVAKPRSLYILSGTMRYHYTHEVLGSSDTDLIHNPISVERRLSVMMRDEKKSL